METYPSIYQDKQNLLWLKLIPRKVTYTNPFKSSGYTTSVKTLSESGVMRFLVANQIQDNVSHTWEPIENIVNKLKEQIANAKKEVALGTEAHKVSTSLMYKDSNRREVTFVVYLATYNDPQGEVLKPVKKLMWYSCPELTTNTEVGIPHVFTLNVGNIIRIDNAALTAVQPSYQAPYINGSPSYCELSLTFKDLEPLGKRYINTVGRVTVGDRGVA